MRIRRFYFDTHVFSLLAEPAHTAVADRLQAAVDQNEVEVLGSLELLGEFVPRAATDLKAYHRMVSLFWGLCGRCILRTWNELVRAEVRKGNRLSCREAYLPVDIINAARECSQNELTHEEWADGVRQRKDKYLARMSTAAGDFEQFAVEKWGPCNVRKLVSYLTIDRERVREWGREGIIRPNPGRYGLSLDQTTWPDISVLPCASSYIAITVAWRRKRHEARRRDRGSDYYDTMHYILGSFAGELVTNDRALRHACSLIEWKPTPLLSFDELRELISAR